MSLILLAFSSGCAWLSREPVMYYTFDYPPPQRISDSESAASGTLMVYRFLLAPAVESYALEIAESGGKEKPRLRHRWKENPADMVTELILRDMQNSGLFEKTVDQMSTARYRYALEGTVKNLQGVITDGKAKALIEADVTLIDFYSPAATGKELLHKTYRIEAPSVDSQPESIVKALNMAVRDLSQEIRQDVATALRDQAEQETSSGDRKTPKLPSTPLCGGSGQIGKGLLFSPVVAILLAGRSQILAFQNIDGIRPEQGGAYYETNPGRGRREIHL